MNKKPNNRRVFLKQGALLGSGWLLLASESQQATAQGRSPPANETLKTIANLRTIHGNFLDKEIPEATIRQVLQASIRAANAANAQSYSIVVVKDRALMQQVCTSGKLHAPVLRGLQPAQGQRGVPGASLFP